jgi:hypothetical protein
MTQFITAYAIYSVVLFLILLLGMGKDAFAILFIAVLSPILVYVGYNAIMWIAKPAHLYIAAAIIVTCITIYAIIHRLNPDRYDI